MANQLLRTRRDAARERAKDKARESLIVAPSEEMLKARDDFTFFCEFATRNSERPIILAKHHLGWVKHWITGQDSENLLGIAGVDIDLLAPRGSAKAQPLDEPVLTPSGWKLMGKLKLGDEVITQSGLPTRITRITPQGLKQSYKIVFDDGSSTECSDDHLWSVRLIGTDKKGEWRTISLNEIRTQKTVGMSGNWKTGVKAVKQTVQEGEKPWLDTRGHGKYQIPIVEPIEFARQNKSLYLDPYLLGCLIGDGSLSSKHTIRMTTADNEILQSFQQLLPSEYKITPIGNTKYCYGISVDALRKGRKKENSPLNEWLRDLGLAGKRSHEKHIPNVYKYSSIENRIALLQGLLDTDGSITTRIKDGKLYGSTINYTTTSEQLYLDVKELVLSLGGIACVKKKESSYKKNGVKIRCKDVWRLSIKLPDSIKPFRLSRKQTKVVACTKYSIVRSIVDIIPTTVKEMQCITVEDCNQLYVTKDYIVTHNSTILGLFLAWCIGKHTLAKKVLQILYVSNKIELARAKSAAIKDIIISPEYQEIFPVVIPTKNRWADSYWAIDFSYAGIKSSGTERFTMIAAGVKGGIVSKRFNLVVFDDLIKSVDEMATREARLKLEKLVSSSINPTLLPGGRKLSLGTRFRPDDIHCTAFTPDKGWYQIQESAILIDNNGDEYSFWEEWLTLDYLQKQRAADPLAFAYQYQNTIVPLEDVGLKPEWIHFENIPTEFDNYVVGVDLAASLKQKADYTVMILCGVLNDKFYFLDYRRGKWQGNLQILDALLGLYEEWYENGIPFNIYIESVAYQSSLQGDFQRYVINEKGYYDINCYPYRLKGDKLAHLLSISGAYASGIVRYNKYKFRIKDEIIDELINFGSKAHDDCLDATAITLQAAGIRKRIEGA